MSKHDASTWFTVDKEGIRRILSRNGPEFVLYELLANAWDEPGVTTVEAILKKRGNGWFLSVEDDAPKGFQDVTHAYTMFAPSVKAGQAEQRGRFNVGEKWVLAYAQSAIVETMQGSVYFKQDGTREWLSGNKRTQGTMVSLELKLTDREATQLDRAARMVLPPEKIRTSWNGGLLLRPKYVGQATGVLPTEVAGTDGHLRPTRRMAITQLFLLDGQQAWLYEMGIPVCEIDMPWHVNVLQKIPLALDRESVRPAFLKALYVVVLNECYMHLSTKEQATEAWARIAASHEECSEAATKHLTKLRFGEQVVSYDPSDPEANARAAAAGYTVVHGGALSGGEWRNVKATSAILPAGQVTGSPRPFAPMDGTGQQQNLQWVSEGKRTPEQTQLILYVTMLSVQLLRKPVTVLLADDRRWTANNGHAVRACYGNQKMVLNWAYLPKDAEGLHFLIIHELAHDFSPNHLDDAYHDGLSTLGARLAILVANKPEAYIDRLRVKEG